MKKRTDITAEKEKVPFLSKLKLLCRLFFIFFKIGLFSFGGGYTMVAFFESEFVEKKKWLNSDEFFNILAIAESTPGPIAINSSTYIGYKLCGVLGSLVATFGCALPSFIIIFTISLFFDEFLKLEYVQYAFKGIQAGVPLLILNAGLKMTKKLKKNIFNIAMFCVVLAACVSFALFAIKLSAIYYILIGGVAGIIYYYLFSYLKNKSKKTDKEQNSENTEKEKEREE